MNKDKEFVTHADLLEVKTELLLAIDNAVERLARIVNAGFARLEGRVVSVEKPLDALVTERTRLLRDADTCIESDGKRYS